MGNGNATPKVVKQIWERFYEVGVYPFCFTENSAMSQLLLSEAPEQGLAMEAMAEASH